MQLACEAVEGGALYPEEVSAYILAELLSTAQAHLGRPVERAVISVPAYFSFEQREATIQAGRLAGLQTVKLIRCASLLIESVNLTLLWCAPAADNLPVSDSSFAAIDTLATAALLAPVVHESRSKP